MTSPVTGREAAELERLVRLAEDAERCTVHATRPEHADPAAAPPPDAWARWVGQNGGVSLLCRACLVAWMDGAVEDQGLVPRELVLFLWRRTRAVW